jgi:hypothetical protein
VGREWLGIGNAVGQDGQHACNLVGGDVDGPDHFSKVFDPRAFRGFAGVEGLGGISNQSYVVHDTIRYGQQLLHSMILTRGPTALLL